MKTRVCSFSNKAVRVMAMVIFAIFFTSKTVSAQTETLSTGSFIINMGIVPQTTANALKPYGLVYDLLKNYNVPVKWVISQTKVKDGPDFNYNGVDYKGGTFIIPAEFRTAAVNSRITFFGVTGTTTTSPLTVNVTYTLRAAPRWTLDTQNGNIAESFFSAAGVPAAAYNYKTPAQLAGCDDIYVMPHADADWSYYGPLLNWVKNHRGSFWGGCRTGSQIENLFNPANPAEQMNFLSVTGLVPHDAHADGTPPYIHQFPNSVAAQYMGKTDLAHTNGSEQIYLPKLGGGWRATTEVIAYDPTQSNVPALSPGPAAPIVYGRAFGNNNYGFAMYEGGHNISGNSQDEIAAQRAFWNFSFRSSIEKMPVITPPVIPATLVSGSVNSFSVIATSPDGSTLSYQWTSSCGGSFSAPTSANTNYTAPVVTVNTTCVITVTVSDACGRSTFFTKQVQIVPQENLFNPDFNVTYVNVPVPGNVKTNDVVPAGTTFGTPVLATSPAGSAPTITMNPDGSYTFTGNKPGVYTYNVPVCVPGQVAPCPTELLTITVLEPTLTNNPPVANTDIAYTDINTAVVIKTLANDKVGNPGGALVPSTTTVTVAALHGTTSINAATGDNTYTPAAGYTGWDVLTYQVCDNSVPALCATAKQYIYIGAVPGPNETLADDDYAYTAMNTPVSGNVKTNDTDPEGNTQTVTAQTTTVPGKGTLVLNTDGSYTFTPVAGFTGPVSFPYTTCDNGTPQACASATLYVLVSPPLPVFNPDFNVTYVNVPVPGNVKTNDVVPAGTTFGTPVLATSPAGSAPTITMNPDGSYTFTGNKPGVYTYNVPVCVPGQPLPCPTELLTITVLEPTLTNNPPVANTDIAYIDINTAVVIKTLANDKAGNPGGALAPSTTTVTVAALHGTTSINAATGDNTYTPAAGYTGWDVLTYQVCDNSVPALCATAKQYIYIGAVPGPNETLADDDYAYTAMNTPVSGNVKTNDTDPEGNTQTVTAQTTTVPGKGTLVLAADGTYTFTPVGGFTGPVSFVYTTCDNGVPVACASATLYIMVAVPNTPDFTPSHDIDALTFAGQTTQRDMIINITEVLNGFSTGQIQFKVRKLSAFTITYNPTATTANVFGGTAVNNNDWIFTEDFNFITVTLKPGVVLPGFGLSKIGFRISRNEGVGVNTTQNITTTIVTGSGGDTNSANNQAVTSITAN